MRAIEQALRQAADPRPGTELLDAGCGIGLETARLAAEYPDSVVTGLDRNVELLVIARRRADPQLTNLRWLQGDLAALELPDASFDAIRTERVLMYLPDDSFESVVDDLIRLLRLGGRLALFELDYGANILAPGSASDIDPPAGLRRSARAHFPNRWAPGGYPDSSPPGASTTSPERPFHSPWTRPSGGASSATPSPPARHLTRPSPPGWVSKRRRPPAANSSPRPRHTHRRHPAVGCAVQGRPRRGTGRGVPPSQHPVRASVGGVLGWSGVGPPIGWVEVGFVRHRRYGQRLQGS